MYKIDGNSSMNMEYVAFEKSDEKVYLFRCKETMPSYLTMILKTVICLVSVSVSYLILHQEFYLIKICPVRAKFNVLGKLDLQLPAEAAVHRCS